MTRDASFKKVVRRHAEETGQRYTEALTDLEGLGARMHHEPVPEQLLAHLRDRYDVDPVAATKLSVHKTYVFRIDRHDGSPWVTRAFPPARPRAGVEGDAAILRFLERQDYPGLLVGSTNVAGNSPRERASGKIRSAADRVEFKQARGRGSCGAVDLPVPDIRVKGSWHGRSAGQRA
jgi:hypothetical protein